MNQSAASPRPQGKFLGFPLEGFSLFPSFLLTLATGFLTFFLTTFLAIIALLIWNVILGHSVSYADTYRYVGFPAGLIALFAAAILFGTLWLRAKLR